MSLFKFDFATGKLPPWLNQFVTITRPLAVNALIAIPTLGALTVGTVAFFDFPAALNMAAASTAFLKGIPDAAYGLIAATALGYTGAKSWEAVKTPPPPAGAPTAEEGPNAALPARPSPSPSAYDLSQE